MANTLKLNSLKEEIKVLTGKKRRFMLYRIAEVEADVARKLCDVSLATYNGWFHETHPVFQPIYRRLEEFIIDYKQEAIKMLRRDNQMAAVILESNIIAKMKEEIDTGEYNLIRTNLARDVYTRLMGDLDIQAPAPTLSWEQRIQQIFVDKKPEEVEGQTTIAIEGEIVGIESPQDKFSPNGEVETVTEPSETITEPVCEQSSEEVQV